MLVKASGGGSDWAAIRVGAAPVDAAEELATALLAPTPGRLRHTKAVAARAALLTAVVDSGQASTLIAAAWLHDIGYAEALRCIGFHPVDGARYLEAKGWPPAVYNVVAHHSGARYLASAQGLANQMDRYPFTVDRLSDALTVADQTTGPQGEPMTIGERLAEQLRRHATDSAYAQAYSRRAQYIRAAAVRVAALLERRSLSRELEMVLPALALPPSRTPDHVRHVSGRERALGHDALDSSLLAWVGDTHLPGA